MENERWRLVEEFPDFEISDHGNLRHAITKKARKPIYNRGYAMYWFYTPNSSLPLNKRYTTRWAHRLLALAFIPNPLNKPQVNHIDTNRSNNHYSNLEWCTASENVRHSVEVGFRRPEYRKPSPKRLLSDEQVKEILLLQSKMTMTSIAKKYGVGQRAIMDIANNRTYKHIPRSEENLKPWIIKFCPQGHEYTPENTRIDNNKRSCVQCCRARCKQYYYKKLDPRTAK